MLHQNLTGVRRLGALAAIVFLALGPTARAADTYRDELWVSAVLSQGNPDQGRKLFFGSNGPGCYSCHAISGSGGQRGPDLTVLADRLDRLQIANKVLFPKDNPTPSYQRVTVTLLDGRVLNGKLLGETEAQVAIQIDSKTITLARTDIDSMKKSSISGMPDGLVDDLKVEEFRDLVEFLVTLKGPGAGGRSQAEYRNRLAPPVNVQAMSIVAPPSRARSVLAE